MSHFKTQQEIWKYLADGGTVTNGHFIYKFENGKLEDCTEFKYPCDWSPYIEPVAKTKVWRWEGVCNTTKGNKFINQTNCYYCEATAADYYPGYTKVPGSEREI